MTVNSLRYSLRALLLATSATGLSTTAFAQASSPPSSVAEDLQEIVVTALKRDTKLQDTPLAITAVTGEALQAQGITDSSQLSKISPGLVITESVFTGSRLTVRNIYAAGEATVGLYYDDTPVPGSAGVSADAGGTTPSLRLFDVDRVEVLRGPQGTLYGSSSEAGTIRLIFAKPQLDLYEATVTGEVSDVPRSGAVGGQPQAMVNIPIIQDKLAVRAVGFYQDTPGYIDNVRLGKSDVNEKESDGGRFSVRFQPTDELTIDGLAVLQSTRGALDDYVLALGPYKQNYPDRETMKDDFQLYSVTGNWDLESVKLTGIVSHSQRDLTYNYDFSAFFNYNGALFKTINPPISALLFSWAPSVADSPQKTSTDTAEFRFASNTPGALQYTAGAFYSNRTGNFDSNVLRADPVSGDPLAVNSTNLIGQRVISDKLRQIAGFAEATYDITSELSATAGVRYYDYTRRASSIVTAANAILGLSGPPIAGQANENGFLYKFDVSYKFTPLIMGYVTASSGERPGGVNTTVGLPADLQDYKSDAVWNYELGLKSELLERKLTINADGYVIDWSNMQTSGQLPNTNFGFIANAGAARVYGSEIEATLRPMSGLILEASIAYNHAALTENESNQTLIAAGVKGNAIPYVPNVTAHANIEYGWALADELWASVRADAYYSGSSWTTFPHTGAAVSAFRDELPSYATVGLRGTISGPGDWSASIFANNLFDNDAVINKLSQNVFGSLDNVRAISLTPRTIGIDVTKHF